MLHMPIEKRRIEPIFTVPQSQIAVNAAIDNSFVIKQSFSPPAPGILPNIIFAAIGKRNKSGGIFDFIYPPKL